MTAYSTPLVSVCLITYNHEKYIRRALESVLAQETTFPIEIVIGEDHSTDTTREIVLEFKNKYPQVIRTILSSYNLGMNRNLIRTLQQCRGKYIALLEGDDLWTSPDKLQKQSKFLENHPECSICFHKVEVHIVEQDQIRGLWPDFDPPATTSLMDLLKSNYMHTCAVMYRNVNLGDIPEGFFQLGIGDWPLHILYAQKGNIGFLNETLARYHVHQAGLFSSLDTLKKFEVVFQSREFMYPLLTKKHRKILGPVLLEYCYQLARMSLENQDTSRARQYLARGMRYFPHFGSYRGRNVYLKLCLRVFFPQIYASLSSVGNRLSRLRRPPEPPASPNG